MMSDRFRWVYCQLDTLRRCMPSSIRKALNELPITLDDTYERILQGIPKEKFKHARRLFQCIVAAIQPLQVEELAEIFAIEFDPNEAANFVEGWRPENPEEAVLSACSSLIAITDDQGSKIVQFSHFSVKEFLTSDRLQTSDIDNIRHYYVSLEPAHMLLARACIAVLLQLDEEVDRERVTTFPLAWYAAENWVNHVKFENVESQIEDALEYLFDPMQPHLRACIWMYDVDRKCSRFRGNYPQPPPLEATPLYYAASLGFSRLAKSLIITHAEDVNAKCYYERTPLFVASRRGYVDVTRLLLDHGADLSTQTIFEKMQLHVASGNGHLKVAQLLLERGAALNVQTKRKETPLCLASKFGHLEVVQLLLDHGADVHIRGEKDRTPYQVASYHGHHDVAQLLLEYGAKGDMWVDEAASVSSMSLPNCHKNFLTL